ncbi:MAG TPA: site-2 protease family protein, partial [Actinomycetes bacterium]|nr:site-2 protease family protein [Actinomycetes bacterium]
MMFTLGVFLFALGILVSVCLHEAGHLVTAKSFGMKATQYFAGFGPTLWSFRRGETEYGLKALPAGGFVKIVGMTPLEELSEEDRPRAFYRFPLWQRTVVLIAGSLTHFLLALVFFFFAAWLTGLPNPQLASYDAMSAKPVIGQVAPCVVQAWDLTKDGELRACRSTDPVGPAKQAGL